MGLFATKKIPPRTHIIDYLGEVHADDRANSDYDLSLYRVLTAEGAINVGVSLLVLGDTNNGGHGLTTFHAGRCRMYGKRG